MGLTTKQYILAHLFVMVVVLVVLGAVTSCSGANFEVDGEYSLRIKSPFTLTIPGQWDIAFWTSSPGVGVSGDPFSVRVTAAPGVYKITAQTYRIIWDEQRTEQGLYTITFEVVGTNPNPDPKPDPDPEPDPTPDVARVEQASRDKAIKLNDQVTAQRLADVTEKAIAGSTGKSRDQLRLEYKTAVAEVLLTREGTSQQKDWLSWREAIDDAIQGTNITASGYLEILKAIERGLEQSIQVTKLQQRAAQKPKVVTPRQVTMYTRPNCYMRDQWAVDVEPMFRRNGFKVQYVDQLTGSVPYYEIKNSGQRWTMNSYMTPRAARTWMRQSCPT